MSDVYAQEKVRKRLRKATDAIIPHIDEIKERCDSLHIDVLLDELRDAHKCVTYTEKANVAKG